jgi:hypothetical protein
MLAALPAPSQAGTSAPFDLGPLLFLIVYGPALFTALLVIIAMGLTAKATTGHERVLALLFIGAWGVAACIHFLPEADTQP